MTDIPDTLPAPSSLESVESIADELRAVAAARIGSEQVTIIVLVARPAEGEGVYNIATRTNAHPTMMRALFDQVLANDPRSVPPAVTS